ncbi:cysteine dioxygenase [Sphingomonas sp. SRS2]|uniref:cysteine dioxygenase family protein n=1 Tax=Sphingomonas sp. SRS2 TaxID=133190 RepID=UPI0006184A1E|nr:cysteine dioxygenase [Sphingomonas sp. SRS2]KKC27217.1 cysteine dioxygenase [Sphingomonas sp. SRS2]
MSALSLIHASDTQVARLAAFVDDLRALIVYSASEDELLSYGRALLAELVRHDDWLPDAYAASSAQRYQQYPLHIDSAGRFSVVSFVWGPGQATPIHDHRVWGLVGVLRGAELAESFAFDSEGALRSTGPAQRLGAGSVDAVSPRIGDIHRVANAYDDRVSISIHVYGADIGRVERATYDRSGAPSRFVSGYAGLPALIA